MRLLDRFRGERTVVMSVALSDQVPELNNNREIFRNTSLVQQSINIVASFTTQKGFHTVCTNAQALETIQKFNLNVNLDGVIYSSIVDMNVDGRSAYEILYVGRKPSGLKHLVASSIRPKWDSVSNEITGYEYKGKTFKPEQVLYFTRFGEQTNYLGQSAIPPIKDAVNTKNNLMFDLKQCSKRLWAPIGLYQVDTSGVKSVEDKQAIIDDFKAQLKPGRSVVYNSAVVAKQIDLKPDINGIIRAIDKCEEEIMGNWGVPKALLSREKTVTKATLEQSVKALYEGPVSGVQRYLKREIEDQLYSVILKGYGYKNETAFLVWNPIVSTQDPVLIEKLFALVDAGHMKLKEVKQMLGWEE